MKTPEQVEQYLRMLRVLIEGRHATGGPCRELHRDETIVLWVLGRLPDPPQLAQVDRLEECVALIRSRT